MRRLPVATLVIGGLLVAVLLTYLVTFKVRFNETAIKVHLGRADESSVIKEPAIHFRWPPPIDTVYVYDTRLQTLDVPESEIKTLDQKNVIVGTYAFWKIADPLKFHIRVRSVGEAESKIRARISQVRAAVIGATEMSSFVGLDPELVETTHDRLQQEMVASAAPALVNEFGIELLQVKLRRISLPETTNAKIFESQTQERRNIAERYRGEGKSKAEEITAQAQASADQIMAFADRLAQEIRSSGYAGVTPILEQIRDEKDRDFFLWLRTLEAMRVALRQRSTIFLDSSSPFYAPLTSPTIRPFDLDGGTREFGGGGGAAAPGGTGGRSNSTTAPAPNQN